MVTEEEPSVIDPSIPLEKQDFFRAAEYYESKNDERNTCHDVETREAWGESAAVVQPSKEVPVDDKKRGKMSRQSTRISCQGRAQPTPSRGLTLRNRMLLLWTTTYSNAK